LSVIVHLPTRMGQGLPKAVSSVVVRRYGGVLFRVGVAEMNGWRVSMEDAHVVHMRDTWGFFGVFDGHGGDQCSSFIARRLVEELAKGMPKDDASMSALALRLDLEFLEMKQPSGSTGTFAIVQPSTESDGQYLLRVGNIGDSRVLLGRLDGTMVEGSGTDGGLTTDHKPDHPAEKERILRTGGTVQEIMGVARVNGDLAVSRAFGDAQHKETGGPAQEDHPVSAVAEHTTLTCGSTDFLMLVCDGISESEFPNREVVRLAAEKLRAGGDKVDPGITAAAICRMALHRGSKDNLSCMIVLLGGGDAAGPATEFLPGPFDAPGHAGFRKAYSTMAEHAGLTLGQALEMRYTIASQECADLQVPKTEEGDVQTGNGNLGTDGPEDRLKAVRAELAAFAGGPPCDMSPGSPERTEWFSKWLDNNDSSGADDNAMSVPRDQIMATLESNPTLMAMAQEQGLVPGLREVIAPPLEKLRSAVQAHSALKWHKGMAVICGARGSVIKDDIDGTSQVSFAPPVGVTSWLPTSCLIDAEEAGRLVRVASVDELRPAVEANSALKWFPNMADVCGQIGKVHHDDADGTSQVVFPHPVGITAWLPTCVLTDVADDEMRRMVKVCPAEELRAAMEANPEFSWPDDVESACGQVGMVMKEDFQDGTADVKFPSPLDVVLRLPSGSLKTVENQSSKSVGDDDCDASKRQRLA